MKNNVLTHPVIIKGVVPSKSNCYKIIRLQSQSVDNTGCSSKKYHGSLCKKEELVSYEHSFMLQLPAKNKGLLLKTPFELIINVYLKNSRQDLDNTLKVVLDCLEFSETIYNDSLCCKIVAEKFIDKEDPRIEFNLFDYKPKGAKK